MFKLKKKLGFTQEALQEDNEYERRVSLYDGLVETRLNLTPREMMLWMDRSFIRSYPVLNSEEFFGQGSLSH